MGEQFGQPSGVNVRNQPETVTKSFSGSDSFEGKDYPIALLHQIRAEKVGDIREMGHGNTSHLQRSLTA